VREPGGTDVDGVGRMNFGGTVEGGG